MMTESEVRAACERYNQSPSADSVAELRRCVGNLAVLFLAPGGKALDVAKTGQAWSYCTLTKAKRAPGGKTTAEVLQSTVGTLPASPYDGRPLFMGVTPEGVDYNSVSEARRRWISYGRLSGQLTCSEQEAVDEALVPPPTRGTAPRLVPPPLPGWLRPGRSQRKRRILRRRRGRR